LKKRQIEIAVISDVHLGTCQCHAEELLAYLSSIRPKKLILNGDLIHQSRTTTTYFPQSHYRVLKKIFGMAAAGTEVHYICGSHETAMRSFRGYNLGDFHIHNKLLLELDGMKTLIFHGDLFGILPSAKWLTKLGSPGYGLGIGLNRVLNWFRTRLCKPPVSATGKPAGHPEKSSVFVQRFENAVSDFAIRNGIAYVICGYLHRAQKKWMETPKGKTLYMNCGDWVENLTALEYNFKRWKLYRYDEDKLSPFYADEDLKEMDINDLISSIMAKKVIREPKQK
jgi:UDP-2,3-diacylglucosamine pyrophosphatase LpxH